MKKTLLAIPALALALASGAYCDHNVTFLSVMDGETITNIETVAAGQNFKMPLPVKEGFRPGQITVSRGKTAENSKPFCLLAVGVEQFPEELGIESSGGHDEQAETFANFMKEGGYLKNSDVTVMKNCTKAAMRQAFVEMAGAMDLAGTFCFVYSGAGTVLGDVEQEGAALTNVICLTDDYYTPEEFAQDLSTIKKGVNVICILGADCAGGLSPNYSEEEPEEAFSAAAFAKAARKSLNASRAKAGFLSAGSNAFDNVSVIASAYGDSGAFYEEGKGDWYLNLMMEMGATPTADLDHNGFISAHELYYSPAVSLISWTLGFGFPYIDNEELAARTVIYSLGDEAKDSIGSFLYDSATSAYSFSYDNVVSDLDIRLDYVSDLLPAPLVKSHSFIEDLQDDSSEPWMYNKYSYVIQIPSELGILPTDLNFSQIFAPSSVPIGCSFVKMDKKLLKAQYYIHDEYWFEDGAVKVSLNPKKHLLTFKIKSKAYSMLHTAYAQEIGLQSIGGMVRYAGCLFPVNYNANVSLDLKKMKAKLAK